MFAKMCGSKSNHFEVTAKAVKLKIDWPSEWQSRLLTILMIVDRIIWLVDLQLSAKIGILLHYPFFLTISKISNTLKFDTNLRLNISTIKLINSMVLRLSATCKRLSEITLLGSAVIMGCNKGEILNIWHWNWRSKTDDLAEGRAA